MPLFTKIYDHDIEKRLVSGRIAAFYSLYEAARDEARQSTPDGKRPQLNALPQLNILYEDDCMGLEDWTSRLMRLPDGDFLYTSYGKNVAENVGFTMIGRRLSGRKSDAFDFFRHSYERAATARRPLLTFSSALASRDVASWYRLILPCIDEAEHLHLLTVLQPVDRVQTLITSLLEATDDPILAIQMVRNSGQDVVDGRVLSANQAAMDALGITSTRHLNLSDCAPILLDSDCMSMMEKAFAKGQKSRLNKPITFGAQTFAHSIATPYGDGVVLHLKD